MKIYKTLLDEIDVSEIEFRIYEAMLRLGATTVLQISNTTGIPRSTVHQNIEKLLSKSMVSQVIAEKKRRLVAENPEVIKRLLDQRKMQNLTQFNKLESIDKALPGFINNLELTRDTTKASGLEVKYYSKYEQIQNLYDEILSHKTIKSYVNYTEVLNIFPENTEKFETKLKSGTEIWDIVIGDLDQIKIEENFYYRNHNKYTNFHGKVLDSTAQNLYMDYLIYDNCVSIVTNDGELKAITIKNKTIYEHALFIYEIIWNALPNFHNNV